MTTSNRQARPKHVYQMTNPVIWAGKDIWPTRTDVDDIRVLVCDVYVGDETVCVRTSTLVNVNLETGTYETLNSIYQVKS